MQQQAQPLPVGQRTYHERQSTYDYGRREPQRKERSPSPIEHLGLMVGIVLLVVGGIFAANSGFDRTSSATPPATSQLPGIAPAPAETPASKPQEKGQEPSGVTGILPSYVQEHTGKQPPYIKSSGERIHLVNNPDAQDVSFAELKSFILKDDTDEERYVPGVRMCAAFAETLHNNAERIGIRAAFVGIDFVAEESGHAINAFETTDRGLVYVDCGGKEKGATGERDTIAYIEVGKEYGVISIDEAQSLQYGSYVEYTQNWHRLEDMLEDYQSEVDAFNRDLGGRTYLSEPEYSRFKAWEAEIHEKKRMIDELADKLGDCWFEPLGTVETVEIYW